MKNAFIDLRHLHCWKLEVCCSLKAYSCRLCNVMFPFCSANFKWFCFLYLFLLYFLLLVCFFMSCSTNRMQICLPLVVCQKDWFLASWTWAGHAGLLLRTGLFWRLLGCICSVRLDFEKLFFNFFYICLSLEKLVNEKYFPVNKNILSSQRKI